MMTTSRWSSVGARHCSTYARKIVPFTGPSITNGATIPSWRSPTTRVMVFQWPWGTDPTNRSPRGQRPRSLTKLVLVAVSSMNTNLAGSSRPCLRIQRRRARATSARSCSVARRLFFDGDIMSLEKSPDRSTTAWNSLLAHRHNDLVQGQIRLLGYQSQQPFHVPLQRRRAPAAQLCSGVSCVIPALQPSHRRTGAQAEAFGRFPPRCSGHDGFDNAFPQVIRIGLRHRFGPPESRINAARLAHSHTIGNPDSTPPESALDTASASTTKHLVAAFHEGLSAGGYDEGRNVAIEYRWSDGDYDKLPSLAADLVRRNVAVIATINTPTILAAKAATKTIPIVFAVGVDPIKFGLVESLNHPGGNLTGLTQLNIEMEAKRVQLLHELAPSATTIALLINPSSPAYSEAATESAQSAARVLGMRLLVLNASTPSGI